MENKIHFSEHEIELRDFTLRISYHVKLCIYFSASLGLTVAVTDICASHEQTEVSCSFGLLDFFCLTGGGLILV